MPQRCRCHIADQQITALDAALQHPNCLPCVRRYLKIRSSRCNPHQRMRMPQSCFQQRSRRLRICRSVKCRRRLGEPSRHCSNIAARRRSRCPRREAHSQRALQLSRMKPCRTYWHRRKSQAFEVFPRQSTRGYRLPSRESCHRFRPCLCGLRVAAQVCPNQQHGCCLGLHVTWFAEV